jgi:hypothetical protein
MPLPLFILCSKKISDNDEALRALAEFLGVSAQMHRYDDLRMQEADCPNTARTCAVSGETLVQFMREGSLRGFKDLMGTRPSSLFIYGVESGSSIPTALAEFTDGRVARVSPVTNRVHGYEVGKDESCRQLAGLSLGPRDAPSDHVLDIVYSGQDKGMHGDAIISIEGRPFYASLNVGKCRVFIMACSRVADIRRKANEQAGMSELFSSLVPPAMYIKHTFGDKAWHSERDRACLIVDDPLLHKRYGFLDFRALAELMDSFDFTASVGFIPWNFKRTASNVADLFKARTDRFSLCVHGCDHTRSEFGSVDERNLARMTKVALERMNQHEVLTGLAFDRIMVFPQGVFSVPAMEALGSNGYLAAVNSEAIPVGFRGSMTASAFLEPAITAFGGFPLFLRRWPEDTEGLATDLFWGRPALITTHHDFFKKGCLNVIELMERIGSINADIEWRSLGDVVRRSHLVKEESDDTTRPRTRVKSYSANMLIANDTLYERRYVVTLPPSNGLPFKVLSGSREMDYDLSDRGLEVSFILPPRRHRALVIAPIHSNRDGLHRSDGFGTSGRAIRTRIRRYLSEVRDNYISRNAALLSIVTALKDRFLASTHRRPRSGAHAR